jgi:hypothetical protein
MNLPDILKRPVVIGVAALVLGLILGLAWGWGIMPVEWVDAPVNLLRPDLQEEYLRMSIDSLRVNGDETLALKRFGELGLKAQPVFEAIKANPGKIDPNFLVQYEKMLIAKNVISKAGSVATPASATPPAAAGSSNLFVTVAIVFGALLAAGVVLGTGYFVLRGGGRRGTRATHQNTPAQQAAEFVRTAEKVDYVARGETPPVAQYVTTYVIGDDLFDDSFSIDSPSGEFLGECGVGISETIGVGDPKRVTAFEVWMFDKNDIQTVTKVMMSPHAFKDPGFRSKLEAKGELIAIEPQKQIVLETQTLQMIATVSDMQFGQGTLPDGSYFDRVTLELAIWNKK